jgi:glyoxalase-like protein
MRLRQIALVAGKLTPAVDDLCAVLGIEVGFNDPGVRMFGLENAVMPVGDTFLEVVSPVEEGATAGRYLERRGGDGGYMVMIQTDDFRADRARLDGLGVRIVWSAELDDIAGMHLHPRDVGGAILSLDQPVPPESWRWGGPEWKQHVSRESVREIAAAEIQSDDPERLARRWAEVLAREARANGGGWEIRLDRGALRFVGATDGRGEGLGGFDVVVADRERVVSAARARGVGSRGDALELAGVRVKLV